MNNGAFYQFIAAFVAVASLGPSPAQAVNDVAGRLIGFNDNGAWSWFQDKRAIVDVDAGKIIVSSVASAAGAGGEARDGDVDVAALDVGSGQVSRFVLHDGLQADDHDSAGLWIRPDGRYLAMYSRHNSDRLSRYRISLKSGDISTWSAEQTFDNGAGTTYSNLAFLAKERHGAGRLYNFSRTVGFNPNLIYSDDAGETWTYSGRLLDWPRPTGDSKYTGHDGARPYLKYATNGTDEIHFLTTEDHPRAYDNSIYHGVIRNGKVYDSFGQTVDEDVFDANARRPNEYSIVWDTDESSLGFAWIIDAQLDGEGRPYAAMTAQAHDSTSDHRFLYARFDGKQWNVHELARAGGYLYAGEYDYTGLVALDPSNPNRLFISTNVDPRTQGALAHYEIFEGRTEDGGRTWKWSPITYNSTADNLRPIVPKWDDEHTALLWMRGTYHTYTRYSLRIVGLTAFEPIQVSAQGDPGQGDRTTKRSKRLEPVVRRK